MPVCFGASREPFGEIPAQAQSLMQSRKFEDAHKLLDSYTRANPRAGDAALAYLLKGQCEEPFWSILTPKKPPMPRSSFI